MLRWTQLSRLCSELGTGSIIGATTRQTSPNLRTFAAHIGPFPTFVLTTLYVRLHYLSELPGHLRGGALVKPWSGDQAESQLQCGTGFA